MSLSSCRCRWCKSRSMILLQLAVRIHQPLDLIDDGWKISRADGEVQLIVAQAGVNAVSDAAEARNTFFRLQRRGDHRASRTAERRARRSDAGGGCGF